MRQISFTSIEQSKKLVEAGLNKNTADMFYIFDPFVQDIAGVGFGNPEEEGDIPCWSVGNLIEMLPKSIFIEGEEEGSILEIYTTCLWDFAIQYKVLNPIPIFSKHLIDAVVEMFILLLEKKLIKIESNE